MSDQPNHCSSCGMPIALEPEPHGNVCPACLEGLHDVPTAVLPRTLLEAMQLTPRPEAVPPAALEMPEIPGLSVESFIGRGGMGIVWLAEQLATGRQVAVKQIRGASSWSGDTMARARFEREIELAARLDHPNIARVFDGGEVDGVPYCVMEYIKGRQVVEYVQQNGLGRREILGIMEKIGDAVDHAHRRGVLHRDLKPSNILVTDEGEPKLLDFGLARGVDDAHQTLTLEGGLAGTPAYMSPEQARGENRLIDTRSDVYSLGVVFYELLTRQHPYPVDGPLERVLANVSRAEVTRPRLRDRSIPPDLEMLLLHTLAAAPADRYASAGELAEDIRRFLRHEPLVAGRTSSGYFLRKWIIRNRAACAAVATLLATAAGATVYHWRTLAREKHAALAAEARTTSALNQFLRSAILENMQRGNYQQALEFVRQAEKSDQSADDELLFQRIEAMEALGDPAYIQLIETMDRSRLRPVQQVRLDYWKAERMLHKGQNEKAAELLRQSLGTGLLPPVEQALARAALAGTISEAVGHYTEAAKQAPWRSVAQRNLLIGLVLSGRSEEARARLQLCYLLFPVDDSYRGLEAILEAFRGNVKRAMAIVEQMSDDDNGWKTLLRSVIRPLAGLSRDVARGLCGAPPQSSVMDQLILMGAIARLKVTSGGRFSIPAFSGAGPVITQGLGGFGRAMLAFGIRDMKQARETTRQALNECDTADLWAILSVIEADLGNYEDAMAASHKAQSLPSLFPGIKDAARMYEGSIEAMIWMKSKDPGCMTRANAAFREVFNTKLPLDAVRQLAWACAMRAGDLVFARQVAASMKPDSPEQSVATAKIEYADGNPTKSLRIAENAIRLFPGNAEVQGLAEQIRMGTVEVIWPGGKVN